MENEPDTTKEEEDQTITVVKLLMSKKQPKRRDWKIKEKETEVKLQKPVTKQKTLKVRPEIPIFHGDEIKDEVTPAWMYESVEQAREKFNWSDEETAAQFKQSIRGKAKDWLDFVADTEDRNTDL